MVIGCFSQWDLTPKEIELRIERELSFGSTRSEIEAFLDNTSWPPCTYDKYNQRYSCGIMDPDSDSRAIVIYLYVDAERRLQRFEAHYSYTAL